MDKTDKYKVLAALVRSFFSSYAGAILDCKLRDASGKYMPQTVKQSLLDHYGQIGGAFNAEMLYSIAPLNFSYEETEQMLREAAASGRQLMEIMRSICATEPFYNAMVDNYKQNFTALLAGRFVSITEHLQTFAAGDGDKSGTIDTDMALRAVVRTVMNAYSRGLRDAGTGKTSLHQATILRLVLENVICITHDTDSLPAYHHVLKHGGFNEVFTAGCRSPHNFEVVTRTMDECYQDLVNSGSITSRDDRAS